jgi:two-component system NtrC family sensor kinase
MNNENATVPKRVLVLDDQEAVADLLTEMVRVIGHEPTTAYSAEKALRRLEEGGIDLVLSDFRMPHMDGEEFYRAAIAMRPELANKIVFLTGDTLCDETQRFLQATGAPYISKPFRMSSVQQTIDEALNHEATSQ